jgi:catechol 2,3-dioxygenase-like lactoylglutathione lyase family enzyme
VQGVSSNEQLISGVDFITVPTTDYEVARRFYGEVLGLPFSKQWGDMPAGEFENGTVTLAVMQSDAFGIEFAPHTHPIAFHVDDFDSDVIDSGVCWQVIFRDPDGNALAIHHRYAPQASG